MGERLALIFSIILKQRLQSLVSHRLAALVFLGFDFISTELLLPGSPSKLQNKNSTEPKLETDSGADVSTSVINVWFGFSFFLFLGDGESLTVACDSSFTSKQQDTHTREN